MATWSAFDALVAVSLSESEAKPVNKCAIDCMDGGSSASVECSVPNHACCWCSAGFAAGAKASCHPPGEACPDEDAGGGVGGGKGGIFKDVQW